MAVSELPGNPNAVWTVKTNIAGLGNLHEPVSLVNMFLNKIQNQILEQATG